MAWGEISQRMTAIGRLPGQGRGTHSVGGLITLRSLLRSLYFAISINLARDDNVRHPLGTTLRQGVDRS